MGPAPESTSPCSSLKNNLGRLILDPAGYVGKGNGAQERTRTFTAVKPLAPEASASTNSTTWAQTGLLRSGYAIVKLADGGPNALYRTDMMAYRESAKSRRERPNLTGRN
jgi:hypothetical protein